jgi:hypothetical protein
MGRLLRLLVWPAAQCYGWAQKAGAAVTWERSDNTGLDGSIIALDKTGAEITLDACKELCFNTVGCAGFTFDGQCWPRSDVQRPREELGNSLFTVVKTPTEGAGSPTPSSGEGGARINMGLTYQNGGKWAPTHSEPTRGMFDPALVHGQQPLPYCTVEQADGGWKMDWQMPAQQAAPASLAAAFLNKLHPEAGDCYAQDDTLGKVAGAAWTHLIKNRTGEDGENLNGRIDGGLCCCAYWKPTAAQRRPNPGGRGGKGGSCDKHFPWGGSTAKGRLPAAGSAAVVSPLGQQCALVVALSGFIHSPDSLAHCLRDFKQHFMTDAAPGSSACIVVHGMAAEDDLAAVARLLEDEPAVVRYVLESEGEELDTPIRECTDGMIDRYLALRTVSFVCVCLCLCLCSHCRHSSTLQRRQPPSFQVVPGREGSPRHHRAARQRRVLDRLHVPANLAGAPAGARGRPQRSSGGARPGRPRHRVAVRLG